jgi:hypothetical protein
MFINNPFSSKQNEGGVESIINILQLLKNFYESQKLQFTYPVIPRPQKGRPSYKRSLQPSKGNIQRFKT